MIFILQDHSFSPKDLQLAHLKDMIKTKETPIIVCRLDPPLIGNSIHKHKKYLNL